MLLGRDSIAGTKLRTANLSRRLLLPVLVAKYMRNHSSLRKDTEAHILLSICPLASSFATKCPLPPVNRKPCYLSLSAHLPPHMQKRSNRSIPNYAQHRTHLQVRGPATSLLPLSSHLKKTKRQCNQPRHLAFKERIPPLPLGLGTTIFSSLCPFAIPFRP